MANVAAETASGEGGLDVRAGVRHFAAGAKVRVLPPQWGDGGHQVIVAGYHRGAHGRRGLARMVMPRRHLTGFRVRGAYSPAVIRALTRPLTELGLDHAPRLWATRQQAGDIAAARRALPLAAHADDWSFTTAVADPPPLQITREGRTYYLAHFNAHRAVYSPHLPPASRLPLAPGAARRRGSGAAGPRPGRRPAGRRGAGRSGAIPGLRGCDSRAVPRPLRAARPAGLAARVCPGGSGQGRHGATDT